ncbi:ACT domain-containing protein [Amycolatopsis jejuensis]|uniref:ACT domain-containing protein n=1 Tax=Amycolatopsis jejuensis TaxID=330084 RepID=UPI000524B03A|nr:ACT domain-containing protein [Amycolatopsis jejuensis]
MPAHVLSLIATDAHAVPARVCSLLAQRRVAVDSMQISRLPGAPAWWIQLGLRPGEDRDFELLIKRMNRLVDVVKVVGITGDGNHWRQAVFVALRPESDDLVHIGRIVGRFGAEILDSDARDVRVHLSAHPEQCAEFVEELRPYGVQETLFGAVSAMRGSFRRRHPRATS